MITQQVPDWWLDAKFGMFIHWGIYACLAGEWNGQKVKGNSEWIQKRLHIPAADYRAVAKQFYPRHFDAQEWVRAARDAGMKYIVFTAKHHDGFAMFRSCDPYNIVDSTPFGLDPVDELSRACRKYGILLCLYYSHVLDWHEQDAFQDDIPVEDLALVREGNEAFARYLEKKCKPQLTELLTHYGSIGGLWFDMPGCIDAKYCREIRDHVKALQPECIISGRIGHGMGDYMTAGDNKIPLLPRKQPWEMPGTLNDTWGYKAGDREWKTSGSLLRNLIKITGRGGNYLLNVGPDGDGRIPGKSVEILREIGAFLEKNGDAVYGTRALPPYPYDLEDGLLTACQDTLYYHSFRPQQKLSLPCIPNPVKSVSILSTGESLPFTATWSEASKSHDLVISFPSEETGGLSGSPDRRPEKYRSSAGDFMVLKIKTEGHITSFETIS